jgi:hypothetical protein
MNLFRSEEHVKAWQHYDPASAEGILPAAEWAEVFAGPLFRNRLEPDYLSKQGHYFGGVFATLAAMGKTGPFWSPPPR